MTARSPNAVSRARRAPSAHALLGIGAYLIVATTACGIGKLDRGERQDQGAAQIKAVEDAYANKSKGVALPKGGPGKGTPSARPVTRRAEDGPATEEKTSLKRRMGEFFGLYTPRRRASTGDVQVPQRLRGLYALSDSGDFFIPCSDTARYAVQGTTEARYLMIERMRFIVRGLKSPVYAVFTATYVKPVDPASQKRGKNAAPAAPPKPQKKAIFVTKVDTLTTSIPGSCRMVAPGSRAQIPEAREEEPDPPSDLLSLQVGRRRIGLGRFTA